MMQKDEKTKKNTFFLQSNEAKPWRDSISRTLDPNPAGTDETNQGQTRPGG
jgi:hypothetical protein